jgi:chromosome segregation protein
MAEREAERLAGEAREARARAEARLDAARETVAYAAERIREEDRPHAGRIAAKLNADPDKMPDAETLDPM